MVEQKDETPTESAETRNAYYTEIGKAIYAMQKWRNSSIVIDMFYNDEVKVGDVVKLDLTDAEALAPTIPRGIYYGHVDMVTYTGSGEAIKMNVHIKHVRNEDDNEEFGLDKRPVYKKPEDKKEEGEGLDDASDNDNG